MQFRCLVKQYIIAVLSNLRDKGNLSSNTGFRFRCSSLFTSSSSFFALSKASRSAQLLFSITIVTISSVIRYRMQYQDCISHIQSSAEYRMWITSKGRTPQQRAFYAISNSTSFLYIFSVSSISLIICSFEISSTSISKLLIYSQYATQQSKILAMFTLKRDARSSVVLARSCTILRTLLDSKTLNKVF